MAAAFTFFSCGVCITPAIIFNIVQLNHFSQSLTCWREWGIREMKQITAYFIPRFPTDSLCCVFQLIKRRIAREIEISNNSIIARECLKSRIQNLTKHVH